MSPTGRRPGRSSAAAVAPGEQIKPGKKDPRVAQIREGLRANGYLAARPAPPRGRQGQSQGGRPRADGASTPPTWSPR